MKKISFLLLSMMTMVGLAGCEIDDVILPKADVDIATERYWVAYTCANGFAPEVVYDNRDQDEQSAAFFVSDELTAAKIDPGVMTLMPSASGAKYTDGKYIWWTKGNEAFLYDASDETNVLLADCVEVEEPAEQSIEEQLQNATVVGIYEEPVTLTDGRYEGEPFVEGGASLPVVELTERATIWGDLNGDGVDDAISRLIENSGGTGNFSYIGAHINQDGQLADGVTALIGDRIQIISMVVEDGQIVIEMVTQGPDDGMCCGTLKVEKRLAYQGGALVEISSQELGTVSLDDLMGTSWVLAQLNYDQSPLPDANITITFQDGEATGSTGCNNFGASLIPGEGQAFSVETIVITEKACADTVMETEHAFVTALQRAVWWRYNPNQLAISYEAEDGSQGTLFFDPAEVNAQ